MNLLFCKKGRLLIVKYKPIYEIRNCPICNIEYTINISIKREREKKTCGNRSCSAKLGNLNARKASVNCKICNTEFSIAHFNVQTEGNYCSDECRKQRYLHTCCICETDFRSDRDTTRYCSIDCEKIGARNKLATVKCACCGVEFERPTFTLASNKRYFCSKRCNQRQFSRDNPNRYGSKWGRIRERKVKEDDYTCQRCGLQTFEPYGLNVHHIIPIEEFEDVNDAHFPENLETLCYECHMEHHDKEICYIQDNNK